MALFMQSDHQHLVAVEERLHELREEYASCLHLLDTSPAEARDHTGKHLASMLRAAKILTAERDRLEALYAQFVA